MPLFAPVSRRALVLLLVASVLSLLPSAAEARRSTPPRVELRAAGQSQPGGLNFAEWTSGAGPGYCVTYDADGPGQYPEPLHVGAGARVAHFVFKRRQRPRTVRITAWHAVDDRGYPVGDGEQLDYELRARRFSDGRIHAWVASFDVQPPPDYYLDMYARWRDSRRCGGPRHMLRTYHLSAS